MKPLRLLAEALLRPVFTSGDGRSLSPVNDDYKAPFAYGGLIHLVKFDAPGEGNAGEVRAHVRAAVSQQ